MPVLFLKQKSEAMKKELAIWLDHFKAYIMPYEDGEVKISLLENEAESRLREPGESNDETRFVASGSFMAYSGNENRKHHIEQNEQKEFLERVLEKMKPYEHIVIYGPGTAKDQLRNLGNQDKAFDEILIETFSADKMTENQMKALARKTFRKEK